MTSDRIEQIQKESAYPNSRSVHQALLQVWNELQQDHNKTMYAIQNLIKEKKEEANEYINLGDSNEKSIGRGMIEVLNELETIIKNS